ncbi:DNA translocase FtsK 4TM domain-containing protein, partial [Acidobacteriota bacterium]
MKHQRRVRVCSFSSEAKCAIISEMARKQTKRSSSSSRKKRKKRKIQSSEIIGILAILLAIYLLVSLVSYHSHDPSWAAVSSSEQQVRNYGGRVGASLAEAMLQLLGFASFLLPFMIIYLAIQPFKPEEERRFFIKT